MYLQEFYYVVEMVGVLAVTVSIIFVTDVR